MHAIAVILRYDLFCVFKIKKKNYTGIVTDDVWHSPTVHSDSVVT